MERGEPVVWAPGMTVLADMGPADWIGEGVVLTAATRFDDLVAGLTHWGRPSDGGLHLSIFTETPEQAFFCLWEGFGLEETDALQTRPMRVHTPGRAYHLLSGPVAAAPVLPAPVEWRCASLW